MIQFVPAVKLAFKRWNDFDGRSSRPEFWFFVLFCFLVNLVIVALSTVLGQGIGDMLSTIFFIVALLPNIAIGIRRMHDIDKSGWWILLPLIPLIGLIAFVYFAAQPGTKGTNRFGKEPRIGQTISETDVVS